MEMYSKHASLHCSLRTKPFIPRDNLIFFFLIVKTLTGFKTEFLCLLRDTFLRQSVTTALRNIYHSGSMRKKPFNAITLTQKKVNSRLTLFDITQEVLHLICSFKN